MDKLSNNPEEFIEKGNTLKVDLQIIHNAGLVLLSPWFPRLFSMLGLLNGGNTAFNSTDSQIRAIFIIQRLVNFEQREYKEQELAFNRILTGCPFSTPLPTQLELTTKEMETVNNLLEGVKANWDKMKNTSLEGFRSCFIERTGRLEEKEERWLLTVEDRSYDVLLDTLPWSYCKIRFPWLQKQINVLWRNKQEFDF